MSTHKVTSILQQETHVIDTSCLKIAGYTLANSETEWTPVEVEGVNVTDVYKPSPARLLKNFIPIVYAGDFNCHSTILGYSATNHDGAALEEWASASDVHLLFDHKQPTVSAQTDGTPPPTLTWLSQTSTLDLARDVLFWINSQDLNTDHH